MRRMCYVEAGTTTFTGNGKVALLVDDGGSCDAVTSSCAELLLRLSYSTSSTTTTAAATTGVADGYSATVVGDPAPRSPS